MAKTKTPQEKFCTVRSELKNALIERDEEIDVILTALLCEENAVLVGEPGTAKSHLLSLLLKWMNLDKKDKFEWIMSKFSVPEEIFGPISIKGLKEDNYRRVTKGKLPEAKIAFLDEIWKASTAILNTLLKIMNKEGYEGKPNNLIQMVSASNEWPQDQQELCAVFDRFLFRKTVKPICTKEGKRRLLWEYKPPDFSHNITIEEIQIACLEVRSQYVSDDIKDAIEKIWMELNKEGIFPGDRRSIKSINAIRAYSYLDGEPEVKVEHLEVLCNILWNDPNEQPTKARKIITKIANPLGCLIEEKKLIAQDIYTKNLPADAIGKLNSVHAELIALHNPKATKAAELVKEYITITYDKIRLGRLAEKGD